MSRSGSNDSYVNTLSLPNVGEDPTTVATAVGRAFRVVVNNIGSVSVLVAFDNGALQNLPSVAGTFEIQPGKDPVFVLQPGQRLYAASQGAGGTISIAVSVAIPESFQA